jgi:hypothetical protein
MTTTDSWLALMEERFPISSVDDRVELHFVSDGSGVDGEQLRAVLRIVVFEDYDGQRMVRDIKEQHVSAGTPDALQDLERYGEFLRALETVFAELSVDALDSLMPMELFPADALELQAQTYDEFGRALSAKSRLGKLLS